MKDFEAATITRDTQALFDDGAVKVTKETIRNLLRKGETAKRARRPSTRSTRRAWRRLQTLQGP